MSDEIREYRLFFCAGRQKLIGESQQLRQFLQATRVLDFTAEPVGYVAKEPCLAFRYMRLAADNIIFTVNASTVTVTRRLGTTIIIHIFA